MRRADVEGLHPSVRVYLVVFVALAALTLITVAVSYLDLSLAQSVAVALCIATIKGTLVACYFMHLISEQQLIYGVLTLTAAFLVVLFALPIAAHVEHGGTPIVP